MLRHLTIPKWTPPTSNQWFGKHWRKRHQLATEAKAMIVVYRNLDNVAEAVTRRRVRLEVHGWPTGKVPDADAFDKLLLDALVHAGLLLDDDQTGLEGRMEVTIVRSKERRTIITLEDCHE